MKLEITKEKVIEAASKCSQAKETLKTLFPDVFEDDKYFDLSDVKIGSNNFLSKKCLGKYANKGFYLSGNCQWNIIKDNDVSILVPTKKS